MPMAPAEYTIVVKSTWTPATHPFEYPAAGALTGPHFSGVMVEKGLLSAEERAPGVRTVTSNSPLGSALMGRRAGERITYEAPGGVFTYEVVSFSPYRP